MGESDQDKTRALLASLAGAVIAAIRSGDAAERKRLAAVLGEMDANMPGISEDTAEAKEFLQALIGLLEGKPVNPEDLSGEYARLYGEIVERVLGAGGPEISAGKEKSLREFLTQLSATTVLVARGGTAEDKASLALKLREVAGGMQAQPGEFVISLALILEGRPVDPATLAAPYAGFYSKILSTITGNNS